MVVVSLHTIMSATSSCQPHHQVISWEVKEPGSAWFRGWNDFWARNLLYIQVRWLPGSRKGGLCFHGFGPQSGKASRKSAKEMLKNRQVRSGPRFVPQSSEISGSNLSGVHSMVRPHAMRDCSWQWKKHIGTAARRKGVVMPWRSC